MWEFIGAVAFFSVVIVVAVIFIRDKKFRDRTIAETMGKELWDDIEKEREEGIERAKKFKQALNKARGTNENKS